MGSDALSGVQKFFRREESSWRDEVGKTLAALARQDRAMTEDMRQMLADFGRRDRAMAKDTRRMIEDFARREKETFEGTRRMMDVISRLGLKQSEQAQQALKRTILSYDSVLENSRRAMEAASSFTYDSLEPARLAIESLGGCEHLLTAAARSALTPQFHSDLLHEKVSVSNAPDAGIEKIYAELEQTVGTKSAADCSLVSAFSVLEHENRRWTKLAENSLRRVGCGGNLALDTLSSAALAWSSGVGSLLKESIRVDIWKDNPTLSAKITSLPVAYSSHCQSAVRQLGSVRVGLSADALVGSVNLAREHFARVIDTLPGFFTPALGIEPHRPSVEMRLYDVQHEELASLRDVGDPQDTVALVEKSPSATTAGRVLDMLNLVPQVNCAAKLSGRDEILKPTTRMLEAMLDLVGLVPTNKLAFGQFIDCIYLLFYEGAGKDKLRYLAENGGALASTDCEVIWAIKTLRNKWIRHDPDHGDATGIRQSYRSLSETLKRFGFRGMPCNSEDYKRFQALLVNDLICFLQRLKNLIG